jgi:porin
MVEARLEPFARDLRRSGTYRFGVWHQSGADFRPTLDAAAGRIQSTAGLYATAEHAFSRDPGTGEPAGLGVFVQWGWAPAAAQEVEGYFGGGVVHRSPARSRPEDAVGAGFTSVAFAGGGRETVLEIFYQISINGRLTVQPDLQFVRQPFGSGAPALAAGLRVELGM